MYLLTLPPKQAGFLLSFLISLPLQVLSLALERRVGNDDTCPDEAPTSDGPTSDNSAGSEWTSLACPSRDLVQKKVLLNNYSRPF